MTTTDVGPDGARIPAARPHGKILAWWLLGLLPLSALTAWVVLQLMAASSAAAAGGCGGG
jgi:hypothetical protein